MTNNTIKSNINIFSVVVLTCVLTACHTTSAQANNDRNNCKTTQEEINLNDLDILPPEPPKTGVERDTPIVLMTRQEFNDRVQQSPLWESLENKQLNFASYGKYYYFNTMALGVFSYYDIHWNKNQRITKIEYSIIPHQPSKDGSHLNLYEQEKYEMIETLKLIFQEMIDDKKAEGVVNQLHQQFLAKVENRQYLSDNETIHTYVKHEGKIIAFWGKTNCDTDTFTSMTID